MGSVMCACPPMFRAVALDVDPCRDPPVDLVDVDVEVVSLQTILHAVTLPIVHFL